MSSKQKLFFFLILIAKDYLNVFSSCELVFSVVMFATIALVQVIPAAMEGIPAAPPPIFAKKAKVIVTRTLTFTFR